MVPTSDQVLLFDPADHDGSDCTVSYAVGHLVDCSVTAYWEVEIAIGGGYPTVNRVITSLVDPDPIDCWQAMKDEDLPKGVYTYQLTVTHTPDCKDTEKSTHLAISGTEVTQWNVDWDNWEVTAQAGYTLNQAAQSARVRVFAPDFTCLYDSEEDENAEVPTAQGANETDAFTFALPTGNDAVGKYTVVVDALETGAMAEYYNRDHEPKLARQGLATASAWPEAYNVLGQNIVVPSSLAPLMSSEESTDSYGTRYVAVQGLVSALSLRIALSKYAIVYCNSHSWANEISLSGTALDNSLLGDSPGEDSPPDYWTVPNSPSRFDACLFAYFSGCHTAALDITGHGLMQSVAAMGANAAAGFECEILENQSWEFDQRFFEALAWEWSVANANSYALQWVRVDFPNLGGVDSFLCTNEDQTIRPARWGQ